MHDHDTGEDRAVERAAAHPWTLDNPAHGWSGLSSAVRVVGQGERSVRAVSVAEVVAPRTAAGTCPRPDGRAGAPPGVTATCSSAAHTRYGHLDVDSNLPDARIAPGGPDDNAFTAEVLAAADTPTPPNWHANRRHRPGRAGAAATPLERVWRPDADLRDALDLPVLIVAGTGPGGQPATSGSAEASPRWSTTSTTPRSPSTRSARGCGDF